MNLVLLDYPLDVDRALLEAEHARMGSRAYVDGRYDGELTAWQTAKYNSPFIQKIMDDFGVCGKPRFYFQEPFFLLPEHTDHNTQCSINFVLTDNVAPVTIGGEQLYYKQCLLNTKIPHSVQNGSEERILLKISIFDMTFEELAQTIKYKCLGS